LDLPKKKSGEAEAVHIGVGGAGVV